MKKVRISVSPPRCSFIHSFRGKLVERTAKERTALVMRETASERARESAREREREGECVCVFLKAISRKKGQPW